MMNSHVAPLSEPIHDPNKHTRALRTNGSPSSQSGAAIASQRRCGWDRIFKSGLQPESFKSGRGLLPVMNSHVAPLSESTHAPNKHTTALRTNDSPSSRSGAAIACPEESLGLSIFQVSPQTRGVQEWQGTPSCGE